MFLFLVAVAMRAHPAGSRDILDLVFRLGEFTSIGDALFCVKQLSLLDKKKTTLWLSAREQHDAGIRLGQKLPSSSIFSSRLSATKN
jgi:hypothetical protein